MRRNIRSAVMCVAAVAVLAGCSSLGRVSVEAVNTRGDRLEVKDMSVSVDPDLNVDVLVIVDVK